MQAATRLIDRQNGRSMSQRAVSLRAQLLMAFVVVVVGATTVLTLDAYQTSLAGLEAEALHDAAVAAHGRAQTLQRMLTNRQRRVEGVLAGARELCGEAKPSGDYALALDCMRPMLNAFRAAEGAVGAAITSGDRVIVSSGARVPEDAPAPGALARVTWVSGHPAYVMSAGKDGLVMRVQYNSSEVGSIFRDASRLGARGEAFLFDSGGRFLTPARYAHAPRRIATPPGAATVEPVQACRTGPGTALGIDYRGVMTLHAWQPVDALDGACVDAHVNYDDVLLPARQLRDRLLVRGLIFIVIGALFSLVASHQIAAPVRRLARAARGLRGTADAIVPVEGPAEVRALGTALREASTELAALVSRERAARREAQSATDAKDRFLAAISHELRTPLTAILGWTRIMRLQGPLGPKLERGLQAIERNAETQRHLVEDLLDVSRIVAGRLRIDRRTVQVAGVVERALDAVRPQADEKGVGVHTNIEHPALSVAGDPIRLEQVVSNLAANAVKFSRAGGRVLVAVTRVGNDVQLSVRDDGEGIDPATLPHVFDWFWQGEPAPGRASPGLGLGLGIVRQLVEIHGGSVRAESDGQGLGSRFVVTLPLVASPEAALDVGPAHAAFDVH